MKSKELKFIIATSSHDINDIRVTYRFLNFFQKIGEVQWIGPFSNMIPKIIKCAPVFLNKNHIFRLLSLYFKIKKSCSDYIYVPDPDALLVCILAKKSKTKIIFDIHERYHDDLVSLRYPNLNKHIKKMISFILLKLINYGVNKSDFVIGVGPSRLDCFKKGNEKRIIFSHYVMKEYLTSNKLDIITNENRFNILFGKALLSRGLAPVLKAIAMLKNKVPILVINLILIRPNKADKNLDSLIDALNLHENLTFIDPLPYPEMFKLMNSCQLGIIAYSRDLGVFCVPNRFFEYYTMNLDFIFPSFAEDLSYFLNSKEVGFPIDTENSLEIANVINDKYLNWSSSKENNMRNIEFSTDFLWENKQNELLKFLNINI
tara:strand:+ start:10132 stop:11253 length:1122 start_codon:yes stop_codon:yes gene_type:complete